MSKRNISVCLGVDSEMSKETEETKSNLTKYQKLTDREHILKKPDTYIGSIENTEHTNYVFVEKTLPCSSTINNNDQKSTGMPIDDDISDQEEDIDSDGDMDVASEKCSPQENNNKEDNQSRIELKDIQYIPGLYKLFDEGIVNCRDHVIRQQQAVADKVEGALPVTNIDITLDNDGTIHMYNDGNGIDVAEHPEYKIWIPEMIFGHLRTSTNYDEKKKEKIVGGKNGFGFKLVLIWSTWGRVETVDHIRGLKYTQEFKDNLTVIEKPKINKTKIKPYTRVSFRPDYQRLGIDGLTEDMLSLFKKRVYDISAVTSKSIKVKLNSQMIPCKSFEQYIDLYIGSKGDTKRVYESAPNGRWEYAVCLSPEEEFKHISFVNGIFTSNGGKHVEYVMNQIVRKLTAYIKLKKKVDVKATSIKEQLMIFIRCDIENPSFNSQTKDELGTAVAKFGSTCTVSDSFIEKIAKMGVMTAACALTVVKENKAVKKTDGSKCKSIRGIPKLIDANYAGTQKSGQCTLILCEGDSAKAGIVSGLSKDDRNTIGVYPMKGKIFNTRGETLKRINDNKEIIEMKQILGLEAGKVYNKDTIGTLRYGSVLFMTDQDLDGSHIKGLGLNLFQDQWNSLATHTRFLGFMNTPILKAKKLSAPNKGKEMVFYNDGEYLSWKETNPNGWDIKYYKGLGTSTGKEFKEYFANKKLVYFEHEGNKSDDVIDMIFNKKRTEERKEWLSNYDSHNYLDTNQPNVSYTDFINKELIHFSKYDCERSIPNIMDGLKISQRKILYSTFKKNLVKEIKVAQLSGYVSEQSGYHHGEASLNAAIVGMAQDYVGSNNINLLTPNGQFGTRLQGGKDSASERYIFTQLNKVTRYVFRKEDDPVLEYLDDDGQTVEPKFYVPIVPMILVNGGKGIGTGFSTDILSYHVDHLIKYLKNKLQVSEMSEKIDFFPYYRDFHGTYERVDEKKFMTKGRYTKLSDKKIKITELPVGYWTEDFKQHIESLMVVNESTEKKIQKLTKVDSSSNVDELKGKKVSKKVTPIIKDYSDLSTDKNVEMDITFHDSINEGPETSNGGISNKVEKTLKLYSTFSTNNMHLFDHEEKLLKYNTEEEIIEKYYPIRLNYYAKRKEYIIKTLEKELLLLTNKAKYIVEILDGTIELRNKKKIDIIQMMVSKQYDKIEEDDEYKYLLKMSMDSVSKENINKLLKDKENKEKELEKVMNQSIENMWLDELIELEGQLGK
jgi:DNA topoisomerase II